MKLNKEDIAVGLNVRSFDEENNRWYKAKVIKVTDDKVTFKDIDPGSEFQGMEWDSPWSEIEDIELFQKLG
jgi:hypothetical protein